MISTQRERQGATDADIKTILIVSNQESTSRLETALAAARFRTETAHTREEVELTLQMLAPDLLLLDIQPLTPTAMEILHFVRARSLLPVIMIGNQADNKLLISTLEAGADDYLFAPFNLEELTARMRALLRRIERVPVQDAALMVRGLELDPARRQVSLRGRKLHFTPTEYGILAALMRSPGQTLSHDILLQTVWGDAHTGDYSVLRVNISRLRQKLEENPRHPSYIVTVPGEGYTIPLKPASIAHGNSPLDA